jgi:hypothetical protein
MITMQERKWYPDEADDRAKCRRKKSDLSPSVASQPKVTKKRAETHDQTDTG